MPRPSIRVGGRVVRPIRVPPATPSVFAATHTLGVGRLTMGQAIPRGQVPSGQTLAFAGLATQFDLKTTWDDGSARFATLSANVTSGGDYPLAVGSAATGTFSPTIPTASVTLTISGTAYTATLPGTVSSDPWLAGPVVREWRHRVTPTTSGSAAHPFLRVYFDVRCYAAGGSRVDVTVENCLDSAGGLVTYNVAIVVAGSTVFSQSSVAHGYLCRWRLAFAAAGLSESVPTPDLGPAEASGAIPRFLSSSDSPTYTFPAADEDGQPRYAILGRGSCAYLDMGATGDRAELALYPDWAAGYLAHKTSNLRATTLLNGDLAGSWSAHVRNADGSLVSIVSRPDYWVDGRGSDKPAGDMDARGPLLPEFAHTPSFAYAPYLLTGDRYYADEVAFWGNWAMTGSYPAGLTTGGNTNNGGRGGATGIVGVGQTRGRAWQLRNLVDAAAYLPDAHPSRAEMRAIVANNIAHYAAFAATHSTPVGTFMEMSFDDATALVSVWQQAFLGMSLFRASRQGFPGAEALARGMAAFQLKLFTSDPSWPIAYAGPYYPKVGTLSADVLTPYSTLNQMFEASYRQGDNSLEAPLPLVGYYGYDARIHLLAAVAAGMTGAQSALDYLVGISGMTAYVNSRPGFALDPATYP